jgi:hypothetical protein
MTLRVSPRFPRDLAIMLGLILRAKILERRAGREISIPWAIGDYPRPKTERDRPSWSEALYLE